MKLKDELPFKETPSPSESLKALYEMKKEHILRALNLCSGIKTKAAKMLGISLRNLYRKIEFYGLTS